MDQQGKKPGLAVVIAMKHKKMSDQMNEEKGASKYSEMASDIMEAISNEDETALGKRLKNFIKVCLADSGKMKEESEEEESDY